LHLQWKQPLILYAVTRQVRPNRWFAFCFHERVCGCRAAVTSGAAAGLSACHMGLFSTRSKPYRQNINNQELSIHRTTL